MHLDLFFSARRGSLLCQEGRTTIIIILFARRQAQSIDSVEAQEIVTWGLPLPGDSAYNSYFCLLTINVHGNFARRNLFPEHIFGIHTLLDYFCKNSDCCDQTEREMAPVQPEKVARLKFPNIDCLPLGTVH